MPAQTRDHNARSATVRAQTTVRAGRTPQPARLQGGPFRSHSDRYRLTCPAGCAPGLAQGQAAAARLITDHLAACSDPGRSAQPVPGGPVIHPQVYADRVA